MLLQTEEDYVVQGLNAAATVVGTSLPVFAGHVAVLVRGTPSIAIALLLAISVTAAGVTISIIIELPLVIAAAERKAIL